MTDITVRRSVQHSENRSWLLGPHGTDPGSNPNVTLDPELFDGDVIKSGTVLAKDADGVCGPYDAASEDGYDVAYGHLFSTIQVRPGATRVAGAAVVHGFVDPARLPVATGPGSLDAAARTALVGIHYEA